MENISSTKVFSLFKKYNDRKFIFIQPRGNWGDDLIFKGAEKLARLANLKYETIACEKFKSSNFSDDHVLFILGNGAYNDIWGAEPVVTLQKAVSTHQGIVILGPTTFYNDPLFLKNSVEKVLSNIKAEKVFIFCRGTIAYKAMTAVVPQGVELHLDHDLALNIRREDFLFSINTKAKGTLYAIRDDKESSKILKFDPFALWFDPIHCAKSFDEWVHIHDGVQQIITNRLHSAILGTIFNKTVTLLPNSYHKNRGIWEYSLKDKGVQWQDELVIPEINKQLLKHKVYKYFTNSYKISQLTNAPYLNSVLLKAKGKNA